MSISKKEFPLGGSGSVDTGETRGIWEWLSPGDEKGVVERVDDVAFELTHHFDVGADVDVVTVNETNFTIDDGEFRVERSKWSNVVVLR
jgi:hypothetical protein